MGIARTVNKGAYRDFPVGGTETILVAEDNSEVRQYIKFVLEDFGYKVLEASDGDEAVKIFRENKDEIKLLLFDLLMPNKTGKEAYEAIKKIKPGIKVLFLSGYQDHALDDMGLSVKEFSFIAKPVSPWDILKKVSEVLGRGPG
jgi:two-component system cell cycle sensor histidine kinase/response regulator CckA